MNLSGSSYSNAWPRVLGGSFVSGSSDVCPLWSMETVRSTQRGCARVLPVERSPEAPSDHPPGEHSPCQCTLQRSPRVCSLGLCSPMRVSILHYLFKRTNRSMWRNVGKNHRHGGGGGRPRLDRVNRCSDCGRPRATTRFSDSTYSVC